MIASYTWVLPQVFSPIGLRPENLFECGEPFCVGYLLSPWLRLVRLGGMDPCLQAPNKRPHTQSSSLRSMRLDRRTHRQHGVRPGVSLFLLLMWCWWERCYQSIFGDCLFLSLNSPLFLTIMTFILLVFYYSMVLSLCGGGDGVVFSHFYTYHMTNSNLRVTSNLA